uniref:Uncharacterized protein n=1 Tax=Lactuca sativa TaxID=4236 RepID=A0A9R1WZ24_LACSA|nr:hypothetical protein LSAT_V11C800393920 [Lactuca sativa]
MLSHLQRNYCFRCNTFATRLHAMFATGCLTSFAAHALPSKNFANCWYYSSLNPGMRLVSPSTHATLVTMFNWITNIAFPVSSLELV